MKKYILYIFIAFVALMLFFLTRGEKSKTMVFYGFSENKEQELNFDYDVKVVDIKVNSGQLVRQGDELLEVIRTSGPLKLTEIDNKIALLTIQKEAKITTLEGEIQLIYADKKERISELDAQIEELKNDIQRNKSLLEAIGESTMENPNIKGADQMKLENLLKRKAAFSGPLNSKVNALRKEMEAIENSFVLEKSSLVEQKTFFTNQQEELILKAPRDGIVGYINCSPGENYSSFSKLMSFYDPHPKSVKAYVLESMITSIAINDSVRVSSNLNSDKYYGGIVTGFGTRILEIPPRLSKIPELKMYGREVLISISNANELLQKEKVRVELVYEDEEMSFSERISNL